MKVLEIFEYIFLMMGGLAIFMYGMKMMGENLEKVSGSKMRTLLAKISNNRLIGVGVGTAVTAIVQSSSATTVMLIGFVNVGLMTLTQAASVIMGANIGTTITAQLASLTGVFNITAVASLVAGIGLIMLMMCKNDIPKKLGAIFIGLGMLFVGLDIMSTSMNNFAKYESFRNLLTSFTNPFVLVLIGTIFTAIIQSSSAATGVLLTMSSAGLVTNENALFLILGMNIGTCITAILASIGANVNAKRTAAIHLSFNIIGTVIVFIPLLFFSKQISAFLYTISGGASLRVIANFHTIFNVLVTAMLLPFLNQLVKLAEKIVPDKHNKGENKEVQTVGKPRLFYLDERILKNPSIAVAQVMKEVSNMAYMSFGNVEKSIEVLINKKYDLIEEVKLTEEQINYINKEITIFLVKVSASNTTFSDEQLIGSLYHVVNDIERIGDYAENLLNFAEKMRGESLEFSEDGKSDIMQVIRQLQLLFKDTMFAFEKRDNSILQAVSAREEKIDEAKRTMSEAHIERLNNGSCSPAIGAIYLSIATNLERIADHMTNIAFSIRYYKHN